jgi:protocatechuate 3,4-dioxygenase beta subunit
MAKPTSAKTKELKPKRGGKSYTGEYLIAGTVALAVVQTLSSLRPKEVPTGTSLHGLVSDASSNPIEGASISLALAGTILATVTTDQDGKYRMNDLAPGSHPYQITAEADKFATLKEEVVLTFGENELNITLQALQALVVEILALELILA